MLRDTARENAQLEIALDAIERDEQDLSTARLRPDGRARADRGTAARVDRWRRLQLPRWALVVEELGSGYSREMGIERLMRDVKGPQIYGPSNRIHRLVVADEILDRAKPGGWARYMRARAHAKYAP